MYKDVLQQLNNDRRVNDSFIERLEKNGFEIEYAKYDYWDSQPHIEIGKNRIWLVTTGTPSTGNGYCLEYRYRNEVVEEIRDAIKEQQRILEKEKELISEVLPVE